MTLDATTIPTPIGELAMLAQDGALVAAGFAAPSVMADRLAAEFTVHGDLGELSRGVAAYFAGDLAALDRVPVAQPGGEFSQAAWRAMREVPAGTTITYTELARRAGSPKAVRAAASACARNLVAPVIPCHRIVRSSGTLGGYYYGLSTKNWLLAHEARHAAHRHPAAS